MSKKDNIKEQEISNPDEPQQMTSFQDGLLLEENLDVVHLFQAFAAHFSTELSQYLGKKIDLDYQSIELLDNLDKIKTQKNTIYALFSLENRSEQGFMLFDFSFVNLFIDYLFGCDAAESSLDEYRFGQCSLKVVDQIGQIASLSLDKFISDHIEFKSCYVKSVLHFKNLSFRTIEEKNHQVTFKINRGKVSHLFKLIMPQKILEEIVFYGSTINGTLIENIETEADASLKRDVIDSTVHVSAFLPEIKLPFNRVVNLKPGDLIEISDPSLVELRVDNKHVYTAQVGQLDSYKVVKTIEAPKKS